MRTVPTEESNLLWLPQGKYYGWLARPQLKVVMGSINKQSTKGFSLCVTPQVHVWQSMHMHVYMCLCYGCMLETMGCISSCLTWNRIQHDTSRVFLNICSQGLNKHGIVQIWPETDTEIACGLQGEVNQEDVPVYGISHSEFMSPA